jgi:hypothetical protein
MTTRTSRTHFTAALRGALALAACQASSVATSETGGADFNAGIRATAGQALVADNGLSANGLSANGLSANGLFSTWFNKNPTTSAAVMSYVYRCAAPLGSVLTWKNPTTGVSNTWLGVLGLAPDWAGGAKATLAEQQLITACLGAHVNKYGVHVPIAVEGRTAKGAQIAILPGELATFSSRPSPSRRPVSSATCSTARACS